MSESLEDVNKEDYSVRVDESWERSQGVYQSLLDNDFEVFSSCWKNLQEFDKLIMGVILRDETPECFARLIYFICRIDEKLIGETNATK
jgi:hypothetical protein